MLNNIRKIQQRAEAIETNYKKFNQWLTASHASYLDLVHGHQWSPNIRRDASQAAYVCPIPSGRPCLDLDCLGFDGREQNK